MSDSTIQFITALIAKNDLKGALSCILEQKKSHPGAEAFWILAGVCEAKLGDLISAQRSFEVAFKINPYNASGAFNLYLTSKALNDFHGALSYINKAINISPREAEYFKCKGDLLYELSKFEGAISSYKKCLALDGCNYRASNMLGVMAIEKGEYGDAISYFLSGLEHATADNEIVYNLAYALQLNGDILSAKRKYISLLKIDNNHTKAIKNLAALYSGQGDHREANKLYERLCGICPEDITALYDYANSLRALGNHQNAKNICYKILEINQNFAPAHFLLSFLYLIEFDFHNGFRHYEWRWRDPNQAIGTPYRSSRPVWKGEKAHSVLIWAEQGLGDEIMFASMIPDVLEISKEAFFQIDKRLIPLFRRSFPDCHFFSREEVIDDKFFQFQIPFGSLGQLFRNSISRFKSSETGYLIADAKYSHELRQKLKRGSEKKLIGLSWKSKSSVHQAPDKSLSLKKLLSAFPNDNFIFVNLQYGSVAEEINSITNELGVDIITDHGICVNDDLDGLASLIKACDFIVSTSNVTVHLSGSLGADTKAIIPFSWEWRWGFKGDFCYWYKSVSLFRQQSVGDWQSAINMLKGNLV